MFMIMLNIKVVVFMFLMRAFSCLGYVFVEIVYVFLAGSV